MKIFCPFSILFPGFIKRQTKTIRICFQMHRSRIPLEFPIVDTVELQRQRVDWLKGGLQLIRKSIPLRGL